MKLRKGFVSNSSSSSFIMPMSALSADQYDALQARCKQPFGKWNDSWDIDIVDDEVHGFTSMENSYGEDDGLKAWMENNGYQMKSIQWEHHG